MPKNTINNKSDPIDATNLTVGGTYTIPNTDGTADQALITNGSGTTSWEDVGGAELTWSEITADTTASVGNAYICNATSEITITLPATFSQGNIIKIVGKGIGGWVVTPNTGDTLSYLNETESSTGKFSPAHVRGCCEIHVITDNSAWLITEELGDVSNVFIDYFYGGYLTTFFKKTDGVLMACGNNTQGQLGDETVVNKSLPVSVVGGHSFTKVSGGNNTLALKADGSAWGWGENTNGQLGDETIVNKSSPVSVVGGHSFIDIVAPVGETAIALKADGSAWCWGSSGSGQLGDETVVRKSSPVSVIGGHSFIKINSGYLTMVALKADGSVWCWGYGAYGELGDETVVSKSSPVSVVGGHSFIDIASGKYTTSALKADGSIWGWGRNSVYGDIGDNSVVPKSSPVSVVGGHSFISVSKGMGSTIALKADGSAWAWGYNQFGQLGDETVANKSSPVSVVGGHSFKELKASGGQGRTTLALKNDNAIWAWGQNYYGGLCIDSTVDYSSPILIVTA